MQQMAGDVTKRSGGKGRYLLQLALMQGDSYRKKPTYVATYHKQQQWLPSNNL